jgi:hypothetical protein
LKSGKKLKKKKGKKKKKKKERKKEKTLAWPSFKIYYRKTLKIGSFFSAWRADFKNGIAF